MSISERARVPQWKTSYDFDWPRRGRRSLAVTTYLIIMSWPVVFWPFQAQLGNHNWLGLALPWWIMVAGVTLLVAIARMRR
jgi:hypothetical protein